LNTPDESKSQDRPLTTTSYGVLSILSLREHSTYDLIRQMRMSLHYMWPRAESNVYAEPKRLVDAGLAEAREEWNGQRRRTVYSITVAGRDALSAWLEEPSSIPRFESEALMKVLFAENGTRDDLLATIRSIGENAEQVIRHFEVIADGYAEGNGEYPWRFGLSGLAARLLIDQAAATLHWTVWAKGIVEGWPTPLAASADWGIEVIRQGAKAREPSPSRY
jgi:DNA-binding PadR family transcriptional regulator